MHLQKNVPLYTFTTLHVGGIASYFYIANDTQSLINACQWGRERNLPIFILGGGSNIIIPDDGFSGLVIKIELKGITYIEKDDDCVDVVAAAGEVWDDVVADSVAHGLFGLENLSYIPGTVGAAPVQNIGAYGTEVKNVIAWVEVYNIQTKTFVKLSNKECKFSYRDSFFKTKSGKDFIITNVCFCLKRNGELNTTYKDVQNYFDKYNLKNISLQKMREAIISIRKKKFPDLSTTGTAGSFFKNPIVSSQKAEELKHKYPELPCFKVENGNVKISLAWLLDNVGGWRDVRKGNVGTFQNQPLVIVNYGKQNAFEIQKFAREIQKDMKNKINIDIVLEVTYIKN